VMTESFLIVAIAGVIGLVVAQLAIVNFQDLLNATAETSLLTDFFTWILLLAIVIVFSLLAGIYPAYIISVFNPLQAIKSNISTTLGGFRLRQLLVVFQFTITQVLVIGTCVVVKQMNYFQTKDLGYNRQSILNISIPFGEERQKRFASKVQEVASIENISFSGTPAGYYRTKFNLHIKRPEWTSSIEVENQWVDSSYLGLYGMRLVAGRNFFPSDSLKGFIINETLASALAFASPEEAIGRPIVINNRRYTIIGVVHDFHSQSLREEVDKVALSQRHDNRHRMVGIKLSQGVNSTDAITQALASIETAWSKVYPELAFDFRFFDESLQAYYEEELRLSKLFQIFSIVFIVIGCLGLYGLISFVVNRKMKEVAVRKVFGATVANILVLIGRDYVKLVVIAFSIAVPTAYNLMQNWLNSFAYHTDISWWVLLLPGVMVLLVAMLAVSGQSLKAASVNPSRILKDE
jgi:putative ABC transport system permease protein